MRKGRLWGGGRKREKGKCLREGHERSKASAEGKKRFRGEATGGRGLRKDRALTLIGGLRGLKRSKEG